MTNLKLPTLTYGNLDRLLGTKSGKTIAHATTAERLGDSILVRHHGSPIASLFEGQLVSISKAGWNSRVTAHRLHAVLKDNNIVENIGIRQGIVSVIRGKDTRPMPYDRWVVWANGELLENTLNEPTIEVTA